MVDFYINQSDVKKSFAPASIVFDVDGTYEFLLCYIGWNDLSHSTDTVLTLFPSMWDGTKMVPDLLHPVGFGGETHWFGRSINPVYHIEVENLAFQF